MVSCPQIRTHNKQECVCDLSNSKDITTITIYSFVGEREKIAHSNTKATVPRLFTIKIFHCSNAVYSCCYRSVWRLHTSLLFGKKISSATYHCDFIKKEFYVVRIFSVILWISRWLRHARFGSSPNILRAFTCCRNRCEWIFNKQNVPSS